MANKVGFFWKTFLQELKGRYQVQWFKSPDYEEEEFLLSRHFFAKSWDSTEEVLGQCSLGTAQSWDNTVLGQYSLGTVLGQRSLGTVQSWDSGLGTVLGHRSHRTVQSWDSGLGTVNLGQYSLGTVVLVQWSWDSGLGTVVLGQWSWDS